MAVFLPWTHEKTNSSIFIGELLLYKVVFASAVGKMNHLCVCVCARACVGSRVWLCDPIDCSPPGSSVHGMSQARILEWAALSSYRGSSWSRDWTHVPWVSFTGSWILYHCTTWQATYPYTPSFLISLPFMLTQSIEQSSPCRTVQVFPVVQMVKNLLVMQEPRFDPWVKKILWRWEWQSNPIQTVDSLIWRIPWTEKAGGLPSMGSQRVRHDWVTHTTYSRSSLVIYFLTSIYCVYMSILISHSSHPSFPLDIHICSIHLSLSALQIRLPAPFF